MPSVLFACSQAMIEEAITRAESFSVMYTPFAAKIKADKVEKVKEVFTKTHPAYVEYIYTGKIQYLQVVNGYFIFIKRNREPLSGLFVYCFSFRGMVF